MEMIPACVSTSLHGRCGRHQGFQVGTSMFRHCLAGASVRPFRFPRGGSFWLTAVGCLLLTTAAQAEKGQGEWIDVPAPISSEVVNRVRIQTERAVAQGAQVLVFRFRGGESSDFGPCKDLADFLLDAKEPRRLEGREIVAYIDKPLNGHVMLPVLACQSIYMHGTATLGFDARALERTKLDDVTVRAYTQVTQSRQGRALAIPMKMLEPEFTVLQFEDGGRRLKLQSHRAPPPGLDPGELIKPDELNLQPKVFSEAGRPGIFTAKELDQVGFIARIIDSQQELAGHLEVALWSNPMAGVENPRAAVIIVKESLDRGTLDMLRRKVDRAIGADRVNCLILKLENANGGFAIAEHADSFAQYMIQEAQRNNVLTVAFIPESASGAALFLALACDQIVLGPEARLDGENLIMSAPNRPVEERDRQLVQQQLMELAKKKGYSPALARGLVDVGVEIVRATERPDPQRPQRKQARGVMFFVKGEVPPNWVVDERVPVKTAGRLLVIEAKRKGDAQRGQSDALEWGIARNVLSTKELKGVFEYYGITEGNARVMGADWLDRLVFFLRHEVTTVFLVIIGFTCLILELKSPGLTLPGITAAVCFLLVFWAHSWLAGEVNTLAVLLFLLGLVLIGVELFLLPGFGITGVSGIVMMLLGLTLVVIRQWPQSQAEYVTLGTQFSIFAASLIVAVLGAFMLGRYLPHIPFANRLMLQPPDELTADSAGSLGFALPPTLLGAFGTAVTPLSPAGKACFGEQYIDVTTEGGYVDAGSRVQVIEIEGLRVVVKTL